MTGARTALEEMGKDGSFVRKEAAWRNWISQDIGAKFPPEKDRYHLYVAFACPWAHRTLIVRKLKGLEDAVSTTVVMPVWQKTKPNDPLDKHTGWVFADPDGNPYPNTIGLGGPFPASCPENAPDFLGAKTVRDVYEKANDVDGKYTVPILWDKKEGTIMSNESSDIIRMLNSEFNDFAKNPDLDLYPDELVSDIEDANEWIYPTINNGIYRCGFATSQSAYNKAIDELTASLDRVEEILSRQRFIAGDRLTLADIRLFVTLIRFDEVYAVYFKTNTRSIANLPNTLNYLREIYQTCGVKETVNMEQIKMHYYCSHPNLNRWSIIPKGGNFEEMLNAAHDRHALAKRTKLQEPTAEDVSVAPSNQ